MASKGAAKAETKTETNAETTADNAAMSVRSRLQIEQISSQSSHADTAEGNWRLVFANYPLKELVREKFNDFAMLMSYSKPRRPQMQFSSGLPAP